MKHNFKQLAIWRRSKDLVKDIYEKTKHFPGEERFGLGLQIRKSAVSIPSNIAEGCGRGTEPQLARFLDIAIGSSCELETQLYLTMDLDFVKNDQGEALISELVEIRKMMIGFKNTLQI